MGIVNKAAECLRQYPREVTQLGCFATVYEASGTELMVQVADLSHAGARLSIPHDHNQLEQGQELVLSINTLAKAFTRKAQIRWLQAEDQQWLCGIHYVATVFDPIDHVLDFAQVRIDPDCALRLPARFALRKQLLPFVDIAGTVHVACLEAEDDMAMAMAERYLNANVIFWQVEADLLAQRCKEIYGDTALGADEQDLSTEAERFSSEMMQAAFLQRATDIHIDPVENGLLVQFRLDGQLTPYKKLPANLQSELINRFKVLSGLDIAEKRTPQDGRFSQQFTGFDRQVDIRVATLPTKYGERMTMRLLALQTDALDLTHLGLDNDRLMQMQQFLRRTQGLMIMTGPTGSGKTTTLYAAIRMMLAERRLNVITIEDPIEYAIDGVAQCEVDHADKMSFNKALRSALRHDPDVIMIGEIRDRETADIAIKAALTGHLVLGTLHTNSAAATVTRLLDMGIEPYLVAATLRLAMAQRLVRRLCPHCKVARPLTTVESVALGASTEPGMTVYEAAGCLYCGNQGYSGRMGLFEMMQIQPEWARGIVDSRGEDWLVSQMQQAQGALLLDDAIDKMRRGLISVADTTRITASW